MFGIRAGRPRTSGDEAEKPFWISFSDLMTALMVLFLAAMAVALMAVTSGLAQIKAAETDRADTINSCMADLKGLTANEFSSVSIQGYSIQFGKLAEFGNNDHRLTPEKARSIRAFVPHVLEVARRKSCEKWLKQVIVEVTCSHCSYH